jgi:hypothetical protein
VDVESASGNRACFTCPTVGMGKARVLLLAHHSSDGTAITGRLLVAIEGYGPLVQKRIIVVKAGYKALVYK